MIVITVCSTKGGVGKTSLCANIGGFAADWGWKVLLIDSDPQPSLSNYFPVIERSPFGLSRIFSHAEIGRSISKTAQSRLSIVLSDDPDSICEQKISRLADGWNRMRTVLLELGGYDLVIIDTQGASGAVVDAAILSSDVLLSPIVPDMLSAREFFGGTMSTLHRLERQFGSTHLPKSMNGIVYRTRSTIDSRLVSQQLNLLIHELPNVRLLTTSVPDRTVYRDAATAQIPVHRFERKRRRGNSANETMVSLATELLPELDCNFDEI